MLERLARHVAKGSTSIFVDSALQGFCGVERMMDQVLTNQVKADDASIETTSDL
jgi:hypothetical protein